MEENHFNIQEELKKLPGRPGVYIMHDEKDHIIYVGKAISLKNRVRQYFQSSYNKSVKIQQMVTHIRRFEYIVTDSELEALVLECNLIKEHRPKYNTMLMDDKAYPFIKVTTGETFPRVLLARRMVKDRARYFGPYTSSQAVRDTIDLIHKLYHVRSCNRNLPRDTGKERPCLNYHIHQCDAPCQGYISKEEYRKSIDEVIRFLNGNFDGILKDLEEKMQAASEALEFEKAIEYRELLNSVKKVDSAQTDRYSKECLDMALVNVKNDINWLSQFVTVYTILYTDKIIRKDMDAALYFSGKAIESARLGIGKLDPSLAFRLLGNTLFGKGGILVRKSEWTEAAEVYQQAADAYKNCKDYLMQAEALRISGWCWEKKHEDGCAADCYIEGFRLIEKLSSDLIRNSSYPLLLLSLLHNSKRMEILSDDEMEKILSKVLGSDWKDYLYEYKRNLGKHYEPGQ